jgi:Ca-activated chloride channel family protein
VILMTVGFARPAKPVKVPRERATIMVAIDVSLSMKATDVSPSRLDAAKAAAKKFVQDLPIRFNVGLVSFSGSASAVVAPTFDREAVGHAIDGLQLGKGTAIGEAVFTSLQAIQVFTKSSTPKGQKPPAARIVLLSDGSNTFGRSVTSAIDAARTAHVQVSTIAFGTRTGTVESHGQTLSVPADETTLRRIAQQTGGSFHTATSEQELRSVYKDIGSQIGFTTKHKAVTWRYLMIGLLFLFAAGGSAMLWAGRLV